ncbi:hypothetical protein PZN02_005121 [Sinorhizobium garamanticum]|uniref:Uncharacterized protein n=1 Tax=Sinorhizobium garamanticum TaxID=680247 RepID=A0ABY8DKC0_9HYPH|nr:hypothetical protein [Sinorhizobium garamanticum]WEX91369.1 hypothetical protein PZN02_005121 [Sinorhizobium garamanticum]
MTKPNTAFVIEPNAGIIRAAMRQGKRHLPQDRDQFIALTALVIYQPGKSAHHKYFKNVAINAPIKLGSRVAGVGLSPSGLVPLARKTLRVERKPKAPPTLASMKIAFERRGWHSSKCRCSSKFVSAPK